MINDFLKAQKPKNLEEFGYYLAGLLDADGYISKESYISITFHERELSVAYYIKKVIDDGSITKNKNSRSYRYRCCRKKTVTKIGHLILNKLRSPTRITQFNERLAPKINSQPTKPDTSPLKGSHWLAGFIQGDGSFQIEINKRVKQDHNTQIMVVIKISQKKDLLLQQIKEMFGGVIYYYKPQDYYFYTSSSITNAGKFLNYLDEYQVIGSSFKIYTLWRQACLHVQKKKHLTESGKCSISNFKKSMSKLKIN